MTWKQLTERECKVWKLSAIDPNDRDTWRSGVRSAMSAASQLPGRGPSVVDIALYLQVNQKYDDDDDEMFSFMYDSDFIFYIMGCFFLSFFLYFQIHVCCFFIFQSNKGTKPLDLTEQFYNDYYFNPVALRIAKILWSFGHSESNRVNATKYIFSILKICQCFILKDISRD